MADTQKSGTMASDVETQIMTIRDDIAHLTKLISEFAGHGTAEARRMAGKEAEHLLDRSRQAAEAATERARRAAGSVEDYIMEKPVQSALVALVLGFFIGSMSRR